MLFSYIPNTDKKEIYKYMSHQGSSHSRPSTFWKSPVTSEMKAVQVSSNIYCSQLQEQTRGLNADIICLSVVNTLLVIAAIVGNTVILIALHKETLLHRPSKVLMRNLVASDLCAGFVEIVFVAYWISILQGRW